MQVSRSPAHYPLYHPPPGTQAQTRVGTINAGDYAVQNEAIKYTSSDEQQIISISPCGGELRLADDVDLDFEPRFLDQSTTFAFLVEAIDTTSEKTLAVCNITITIEDVDEPPTFQGDSQTLDV